MDTLGIALGFLIAIVLVAVAAYFALRQRDVMRSIDAKMPLDQRLYLTKQCWRRLFGSFLLTLLAVMLAGAMFLDYEPLQKPLDELPAAEQEAAKQAFRFISFYWMAFLLFMMAVLTLAVFDFWATARYSVRQQKQLFQEHQEMLAAELEEYRHRQSEMN